MYLKSIAGEQGIEQLAVGSVNMDRVLEVVEAIKKLMIHEYVLSDLFLIASGKKETALNQQFLRLYKEAKLLNSMGVMDEETKRIMMVMKIGKDTYSLDRAINIFKEK